MTKAELEAKLEEALKTIEILKTQNTAVAVNTPSSGVSDSVTIVYMSEAPGYCKGQNFEFTFNQAGEEVVLPRYAFDELAGKYHSWFVEGILAVSSKSADVAKAKGLRTDGEIIVTIDKIDKIGTMDASEITKLWQSATTIEEKRRIVLAYKREFVARTPGYRDITKVSILNGLSDGAFARELTELTSKTLKIEPTDLMND